jgi:hypothetical protein
MSLTENQENESIFKREVDNRSFEKNYKIERRRSSELKVCNEVGVGTLRYEKNDGVIHFSGKWLLNALLAKYGTSDYTSGKGIAI